jgi:hypothetical protein
MKVITSGFQRALAIAILLLLALSHPTLIPRGAHGTDFPFTFAAAGDFGGLTDNDRRVLFDKLQSDGVDFILALGDLGYTSDEAAWCSDSKMHFNNIIIIAGNHDTSESGPGSIADYVANCPFPLTGVTVEYDSSISAGYGYEYYFDYPASTPLARFIMITPNIQGEINYDYEAGSPHYNWVVSSVANARALGIPWIVVGMHKHCFSMGGYAGCPSPSGHLDHGMHDIVNKLIDLKVDLVLQAHEHNYQRSKQFALNSNCTSVPHQGDAGVPDADCIVDNGSSNSYHKSGTVIVVAGTGGTGGSSVEDSCFPGDVESSYFAACMGSTHALSSFGSLRLLVTQSSISGVFAPNRNGYFTDSFVIGCFGDISYDRKVDIVDLAMVASAFGSVRGQPGYDEDADLDKNGAVGILDIAMVAANFGRTCT